LSPPLLRCLHAQGQRIELLEEFWSLVIMNGFGGSIYATHLLDKAIGKDLRLPDISHHVMHVTAVAGAWTYQQELGSLPSLSCHRKKILAADC
jgi:adiponectin receptor